ncbi:helix-turn-helix transcriptional regulator [Leptospira sp. GIMC2001]|uniref:helix-turn-helix transcriptional regulator n=1 Tax=Leptospira sp. GIMC2001 TaxID=1513297 RepID=UPI00234B25AB|nr:AraC family transcriptional regulator [Leptospira sp. GIMC2001]WCL49036.1 AraC family transcriptional regulator [Leptospira sp. GIMC2001]
MYFFEAGTDLNQEYYKDSISTIKSFLYELTYKDDFNAKDFFFHEMSRLESKLSQPEPFERFTWHLQIMEGLEVYFFDSNRTQNFTIEKDLLNYSHTFHYTINGTILMKSSKDKADLLINPSNIYYVSYPVQTTLDFQENQNAISMIVNFDPNVLLNFLDKSIFSKEQIDSFLAKFAEIDDGILVDTKHINQTIISILSQIQRMPFDKKHRREFIQLKFLEVIWVSFWQWSNEPNKDKKLLRLSKRDYEKLHKAKEILLTKMDNPPPLSELAKLTGLNEYKLKVGFKKVFGVPPYSFLQDHKLEVAKMLLESGNKSVTEVAITIGYSNFSKFSSAFKKKFGNNPSKILSRK